MSDNELDDLIDNAIDETADSEEQAAFDSYIEDASEEEQDEWGGLNVDFSKVPQERLPYPYNGEAPTV